MSNQRGMNSSVDSPEPRTGLSTSGGAFPQGEYFKPRHERYGVRAEAPSDPLGAVSIA
jgi:hypothetical protein